MTLPKSSDEMVEEYKSFIHFVEDLRSISEANWNRPLAEGKWTLKDVISHIMLWDQYFYDEGIKKIKLAEPVTVKHLDFNEFNANAVQYAKTQTKNEILDQCIHNRKQIIDAISGLAEEEYTKAYKDGEKKKFSIRGFLRGFIPHDRHHKKQIETFIKTISATQ
ncbi:DinB family protein [Paenibacillus sp. 1P07SE]|uniref:DinB family protein n=1 Tax=Paenibacillus sp. 1P07SE TaxID=3132209 RepID=UPI0039A562B9